MPFASNATYSSAPNPTDVGQANKVVPADLPNGFKPEAPVPAEHINYCLARLECNTQTFVANGTWTKPDGAVRVSFILVGGGAGGANGLSNTGGVGGASGEIVQVDFLASLLPASLSVVIGSGGGSGNLSGGATYVADGATTRAFALGAGGFADPGLPPDITVEMAVPTYLSGGAGGASGAGLAGKASRYAGKAGAGGAAGNRGLTGFGYGAGGGGGRNNGGTNAGGGGGAGGYGLTQPAGAGGGTSTSGAAGAGGVCIVTTWREIS
jgi:hypothetical protein